MVATDLSVSEVRHPAGALRVVLIRSPHSLIGRITCGSITSTPGSTLPADAADPTYCGGRVTTLDPRDPGTNAPYAYTRINDTEFRFCARLDDPRAFSIPSARLFGFDPATGCLTSSIR